MLEMRGYIAPLALINTRDLINVVGFSGQIQRLGIASWNIKIVLNKYSADCCVCLPSVVNFTC